MKIKTQFNIGDICEIYPYGVGTIIDIFIYIDIEKDTRIYYVLQDGNQRGIKLTEAELISKGGRLKHAKCTNQINKI